MITNFWAPQILQVALRTAISPRQTYPIPPPPGKRNLATPVVAFSDPTFESTNVTI